MKNAPLKILFFLCLVILISLTTAIYLLYNFRTRSRASANYIINTQSTSEDSYIDQNNATTNISIYSDEGTIYQGTNTGGAAVLEFLNSNPQYQPDQIGNPNNVKGISSDNQTPRQLIPKNFIQNSFLIRFFKDRDNRFLTARNSNLNGEHFFYNQKIGNIPVFAGILAVHIRNGNQIYSVNGNLILNETLTAEKITEEQAKEIALKKAREQIPSNIGLKVEKAQRYILNLKILGFSDDETNYTTLAVTVNSDPNPLYYSRKYFVDLTSGNILFTQQLIYDALNRQIYICPNGFDNPQLARKEGDPPKNDADIDNSYDYFGNTYNYFKNTHGRDSYDNQGGALKPRVNLTGLQQSQIYQFSFNCDTSPNAGWLGDGNFLFCKGMITSDVIAHEFTHGVTVNAADLLYQAQSGALNESVSDIFGYALDSTNWTMGESSRLGIIRYMDDPTKSPTNPPGGQPDRLFSQKYKCAGLPNSCDPQTTDSCGVHWNSGVMNKTFYLMTAGGSFNGCTITGISREKSLPIVYRALTTYLTQQSNFKAMYTALLQSCNDLYQSGSNECVQVKAAAQATEIDQQPENTQGGPTCPGYSVTRKTPECAGSQVTPTITPTPGGTTSTPSPTVTPGGLTVTPTLTPTPGQSTSTPTPSVTPGGPTNTPSPTITPGGPSVTSTPTTVSSPTPTPTPTIGIQINLKLKFQGIVNVPKYDLNKMKVKVTIHNEDYSVNQILSGNFMTTNGITWYNGIISFNIPPGLDYTILIKGPKHIQKKICDEKPFESYPGTYHCLAGNINLKPGLNGLDFSSIYQLVGDLPEQDGIVNSYDVSLVRNNLNKGDSDSVRIADLNLDGVVNTQDYSLIIAALAIRTDEE
jgi:Zn-dependent metalloprotease